MSGPFKVIDGLRLPAAQRKLLCPGAPRIDARGRTHLLPRFFYEIATWQFAKENRLGPDFTLAELMNVDCREAGLLLHTFPHYLPCAAAILARYLQALRNKVGAPIYIATNGGYRSPAHAHSHHATPHLWGAAANIYRIGDTWLNDRGGIEKFGRIAESIGPGVNVKPYGHGPHETDDHLHLDIGYVTCVPRDCDEAR